MNKFIFGLVYSFSLFYSTYAADVLGIGAPIVDILTFVNEDFMKKVPGEKGGSDSISEEGFKYLYNEIQNYNLSICTGGSVANTIKGLACLGNDTAFLGKIGTDKSGNHFRDNFLKHNILPNLIEVKDKSTSQVLAFVTPDGERTFRILLGASLELDENDLYQELYQDTKLVHFEGYSLFQNALIEEGMALAHINGAKISFDLGSFEMIRLFRQRLLQILPLVDVLFANEKEAEALTGTADLKQMMEILRNHVPTVVIKLGKKGCCVGSQIGVALVPSFTPKAVVDTTGAGDLFASGFLHGYLQGFDTGTCALFGNLVGSCAVEVMGAELAPERWVEIRGKMNAIKADLIVHSL